MSPKTSGFQYIHLLSSTEADEIISWKEESPVFSLTHWIPFGENMENPEDDPESREYTDPVFCEQTSYLYTEFHHNYL